MTATEVEPGSHRSRREDIQGLRGVAVLLVVIFHAGLAMPGGFVGVDMFFVISGFVITAMLARELEGHGRIRFGVFYARRVRRLLPALALVVAAVVLVSIVVQSPLGAQQTTGHSGVATAAFAGNAQLYVSTGAYFDAPAETNPLLHMWSLAVEEQFYVLFPTLLLLAWAAASRRRRRRRPTGTAAAVTGLVVIASFLVSLALSRRGAHVPGIRAPALFAFYSSPTRAWEFGVGSLVAFGVPVWKRLSTAVGQMSGVLGAALVIMSAFTISGRDPFPGVVAVLPVLATALLIVGGTATGAGVTSLLARRPLVWVGDLSYSFYLWHWPAVVFTRVLWPGRWWLLPLVSAASLVPAWLSYRFLEEPLRSDRTIVGWRALHLAAICVAVPVLLSGALLVGARQAWGRPAVRAWQREKSSLTLGRKTGCLAGAHRVATKDLLTRCIWPAPSSKGWIMLVGDSHADSLSNGVVAAANRLHYDVMAVTTSSCSFTPLSVHETLEVPNCGELYEWRMQAAESNPKPVLVVFSHFSSIRTGDPTTSAGRAAIRLWTGALRASFVRLQAAGVPSLLVADVPSIGPLNNDPCRFGLVVLPRCSVARRYVEHRQGPVSQAEVAMARAVPSVSVLDLSTAFCDETTCRAIRGGVMAFADSQHLDGVGSETLTSLLQPALAAAIGQH